MYSLTLKTLIRTASGKERGKNTKNGSSQEHGMKATEAEMILFFYAMIDNDDVMDVHFSLKLLDRAADHTYCHNHLSINQSQELRHLYWWSSN